MKKMIRIYTLLAVAAVLFACSDSNSGSDYGVPEYKAETALPDTCEMEVAKVKDAYFACFENKWVEVTDSLVVEKLEDGLDEEEIKEMLEDLLAKISSANKDEIESKSSSSRNGDLESSDSEEPESSSSEECTGRRCKDNVSSSSAKKHSNEESSDSEPESSNSDESSSSDSEPESSNSDESSSSSSESMEITYAFGYALKNDPTPSKGCGTTSKLRKTKSVENGDRFEMIVNGETRDYFITLPKNYDNTKPYKLLFAMHCMSSNAEDFVHHNADQDHPSPYYGQQKLDKNGDYIFVAPHGDTDGAPWSMSSDKDHKFIDQLLTTLEENYCIDTSRVFMTGFSFGAMVTNSMAQDMQDRLRAVAVYATADYSIYLPKNKGLPIAWMAVHGKNDGTCNYNLALTSALPRILKNNGKADADGNFTDASEEKPKEVGGSGHLCYDFSEKTDENPDPKVDERFPVVWCSWNGGHQWTAFDSGDWQNTWVPEEAHRFFERF